MKIYRFTLILFLCSILACGKDSETQLDEEKEQFVPTDVLVKVKAYYTIDQVFNFINGFEHEVENIHSLTYTSDFPSDSLQYILDFLNAKTYTNDGNVWFVNGYLHYQTKLVTIFPRLFDMKNKSYQLDWIESIEILKLNEVIEGETAGSIIFFHVPEGEEKDWVRKFEEYEFVEWAEVNHILNLNPYP